MAHLKKIHEAWKAYTDRFGPIPAVKNNGFEFVHYLSGGSIGHGWQGEDHCFLNDINVYFSPGDKYASKLFSKRTAISGNTNHKHGSAANEDMFLRLSNELKVSKYTSLLSYCLISGLYNSGDTASIPLGFTRGLKSNGMWHKKFGLYGDSGGYVIFLDGHVKWFDGKRPARFLKWDRSGYTTDIREAVPDAAFINAGYNLKTDVVDDDGGLLIIYHSGTGGAE